MRGLFALGLVVAAGCGGSHKGPAKTAEQRPAPAEDSAAKADESPPRPKMLPGRTHAYRVTRRCAQGPFELRAQTLGAERGEDLKVWACGPRAFSGRYQVMSDNWSRASEGEFHGYGDGKDHQRCLASPSELATAGAGGGGSGAAPVSDASRATAAHGAVARTVDPTLLEEVTRSDDTVCRAYTNVYWITYETGEREPATSAGRNITVRFWSDVALDLEGITFVVDQRIVDPAVSDAEWLAYRDYWEKRYQTMSDADREPWRPKAGAPTSAPPPARAEASPPRPSVHAEWVPGSWHWASAAWHWMAGFWRVPDADVTAEVTARAPAPPPPIQVETPGASIPGAVWTGGYWAWSAGWVWVPGAWRLPPAPTYTWRAAGWRVRAGGSLFLPGGWVLRLR